MHPCRFPSSGLVGEIRDCGANLARNENISRGFYCFNQDGSVLFSVRPEKPVASFVEFGQERYYPPFEPCLFRLPETDAILTPSSELE
jgi:hypothetical protein